MDIFQAIKERRSCRDYDSRPIEEEKLRAVLEAGGWAPSVMNKQPWRFVVIRSPELKQKIFDACEATKQYAFETGGWKWLGKFSLAFLLDAPVMIVLTADPKNTGADQFLPGRGDGYSQSCCAAIQNMLLAAHALGLGGLWFSIYEEQRLKDLLGVPPEIRIVSSLVLGYPAKAPGSVPRKPIEELVSYID